MATAVGLQELLQVPSTAAVPLTLTSPLSFPKRVAKVTFPILQHNSGVSLGHRHPQGHKAVQLSLLGKRPPCFQLDDVSRR